MGWWYSRLFAKHFTRDREKHRSSKRYHRRCRAAAHGYNGRPTNCDENHRTAIVEIGYYTARITWFGVVAKIRKISYRTPAGAYLQCVRTCATDSRRVRHLYRTGIRTYVCLHWVNASAKGVLVYATRQKNRHGRRYTHRTAGGGGATSTPI